MHSSDLEQTRAKHKLQKFKVARLRRGPRALLQLANPSRVPCTPSQPVFRNVLLTQWMCRSRRELGNPARSKSLSNKYSQVLAFPILRHQNYPMIYAELYTHNKISLFVTHTKDERPNVVRAGVAQN